MRVLMISNNRRLSSHIKQNLSSEGFIIDTSYNIHTGYLKIQSISYDLVIIAYFLSNLYILELCEAVRKNNKNVPLILINDDISIKIPAFHSGIDDFLLYPFLLEELTVRIKALLRRNKYTQPDIIIQVDDLIIDKDKRTVTRKEKVIHLSKQEYNLLLFMIENKGKTLSRSILLERLWEDYFDLLPSTVNVHICNLREKIDKGSQKKLIHTIHGSGYKLDIPE